MNRWNIPDWLEREVIERDPCCVYCGIEFVPANEARKTKPSWEHIVNDARIVTRENIAICCRSCNASKGAKDLKAWLQSTYCKRKGINEETVAKVVRDACSRPTLDGAEPGQVESYPTSGHWVISLGGLLPRYVPPLGADEGLEDKPPRTDRASAPPAPPEGGTAAVIGPR